MTATYRLQLHAGFTFADAEQVVPYLADLGVTHLYLSPVLAAVPGSMHGYDVVDHSRVSPELGGQDGLESLASTARQHGLGIVVDVVPNHMALVAPLTGNAALWEVLARGREASTASWFDVDWDALDGRIGLPLLGDTLDHELAAGALELRTQDGRPVVGYHDHVFPVAEGTEGDDVAAVLEKQHYVLASWREKDEVLNYRRFFDIDGLIAVRVEDPEVFEATHRVLLDLNRRGVVEGFRIDHPDGLADPEGYLRDLRRATRVGTAVWVEKILEGDEHLPDPWPCEGTTGYDALRAVTAALIDPTTSPLIAGTWTEVGGTGRLRGVRRRRQARGGAGHPRPGAPAADPPRLRDPAGRRPRPRRGGGRRAARGGRRLPRVRPAQPARDRGGAGTPRGQPATAPWPRDPTCAPRSSGCSPRPPARLRPSPPRWTSRSGSSRPGGR